MKQRDFLILSIEINFTNHLKSGQNEFGKESVWFLFLSGDEHIPSELEKLKNEYKGKIGFISWKSLLQLLKSHKDALGEKYEIIIEEFLTFANHYKLGRLVSMDNEELNKFMEAYPTVAKYESSVEEKFSTILDKLKNCIILECEELVEENKDEEIKQLPCPYKALNVKGWHIKESSSYIFIDLLTKNIGIVLNGYQDESEKAKFIQRWNEEYKNKYREDSSLKAFTFIPEEDEDNDIYGEYFKLVDGTSGKLFNPNHISELADYFYWGYVYELDLEKLNSYYEIIPRDFKKLLNTFLKIDTSIKNHKSRAKARTRIRKGN